MEQLSASIWDDLVSADEDKVYLAIDQASEYFSNQPTKLADSSVISQFIQLFSDGPVNAVVTMAKILGSTLINDSGKTRNWKNANQCRGFARNIAKFTRCKS